jgi:hypothetical protein
LTQNQIRAGLLELVSEIEQQDNTPEIRAEIERAVSVVNSKNILVNSPITAGGDVYIGDQIIHTESQTSHRLSIFLYFFVPLLVIGCLILLYLMQPLTLTVFVRGKNGQSTEPLRKQGKVIFDVNGERKEGLIDDKDQAIFRDRHVGDKIRNLNVEFSEPYKSTHPDSIYTLHSSGRVYLEVALQNLDHIEGYVSYKNMPLPGVIVSIANLRDTTDSQGYYILRIPEAMQQKSQQVTFSEPRLKLFQTKTFFPQTGQNFNVDLTN